MKNVLLFILSILLPLSVSLAKKPLEGKWESKKTATILELKGDGQFSWDQRSGKWFIENAVLYLHSPGQLSGYKISVVGKKLVLMGGDIRGAGEVFSYKSKGEPVLPAPAPQGGEDLGAVNSQMKDLKQSFSIQLENRIGIVPLHGEWTALEQIGYQDNVSFYGDGYCILGEDEPRVFKTFGDRAYISMSDTTLELFFQVDEKKLILGNNSSYTIRAYTRKKEMTTIQQNADIDILAGRYMGWGKFKVKYSSTGRFQPVEGEQILEFEPSGRVSGLIRNQSGIIQEHWGGIVSVLSDIIEVRRDDGDLVPFTYYIEHHPRMGRLLVLDKVVHIRRADSSKGISTRLQVNPYESEQIRREIQGKFIELSE